MDPAEQRANAVAMLRRAASLPRMKDGRRPPMRGEAGGISDGERSRSVEKKESVGSDEAAALLEPVAATSSSTTQQLDVSSPDPSEPPATTSTSTDEKEDGPESTHEASEPERPSSTTPSQQASGSTSKRRSRSRSRSRGSRDMKAKLRQLEIAAQQAQSQVQTEAGPDDVLSLDGPALTSPQAYLMQLQMATGQVPPIVSPLSPFAASPGMAGMPTLQALQNRHLQGLFRSNSAAARMIAMHKLTGGSEPFDLPPGQATGATPATSPSPGPGPARARLTRNNTVAGEERVAARQQLLRRLNERIQDRGDLDPLVATMSTEDAPTTKSRRRRSRRKSGTALVDDREAANTPAALALKELYPPLIALPPSRAPSIPLERQVTPGPDPTLLARTPTPLAHQYQQMQNHFQLPFQQQVQPQQLNLYDSPMTHRGPVVEEEDDEPVPTPPRQHLRGPFVGLASSTALSGLPSAGDGNGVPAVSSDKGAHMEDQETDQQANKDFFPKSPFERPREEPPDDEVGGEKENEQVLYGNANGAAARERTAAANELLDREVSWQAEPVPTYDRDIMGVKDRREEDKARDRDVSWVEPSSLGSRMPIYDEDDEEDNAGEEDESENDEHQSPSQRQSRSSPRDSAATQELLIDLETTPDQQTPSDTSATSHHARTASTATVNTTARDSHISDSSAASHRHPGASSPPLDHTRTHSQADSLQAWPDYSTSSGGVGAPGLNSKRSADSTGAGTSTWSRMKGAITRSGSSLGRRSRTNSLAKRGEESSRESAASVGSGKRESKGDIQNLWSQASARSPSPGIAAHNSHPPQTMLSPPPPPPPRTGASPIPPPSDSEAAKYINPKLFPFPGMATLRGKTGMSPFATSNPDVSTQNQPSHANMSGGSDGMMGLPSANSSTSSQQLLDVRERKLSHQASDSRLLPKYQLTPGPAISGAPSSGGIHHIDYFTIPQPPPSSSASSPLPFTREGVKKWLSTRLFSSSSQQGDAGPSFRPTFEHKTRSDTTKKPSLSDLLGRKDMGDMSDWDEAHGQREMRGPNFNHHHAFSPPPMALSVSGGSRIQNTTSTSTVVGQASSRDTSRESINASGAQDSSSPDDPLQAYAHASAFTQPNPIKPASVSRESYDVNDVQESRHTSVPLSSSHDPSSATPDPASSEESPSQSTSSLGSLYNPEPTSTMTAQAADILQRLDQVLKAENHNRLWSSALTTPPRRLLLCTPMLQVANCNTVKDRFLFLFSDLLVIAKPMLPDRDSLVDPQKVYPPDRKFFIKNVVHLKDLRLSIDRDEETKARAPTSAVVGQRPEFIRNFVTEFGENADAAVGKLVDLREPKAALTLGRLLVQLPEIDRAKLGEYLSRRTSKVILKAYLDVFGFAGISIDTALRIFLLSIHIPNGASHANTLEVFLDMFAARWYEANASIVAFDRDLAVRLVRAIVRLNEALHSTISHDPHANFSRLHVTSKDFTEAFRRHDPRCLVPDTTLDKIYTSVRQEKLCQARNPTNGRAPFVVTLKRPIPPRITYRRQSEPIVVRIPQPDPYLQIQLFGQDLIFDPPVLTFAKSAEASFRVTGTAFGPKQLVLSCTGPGAPNYVGMPLSTTIAVERAFMRNTFQLAFAEMNGRKRKYMFSVDDPVIRHEWTGSLKRQMETARASSVVAVPEAVSGNGGGNTQMQVYKAADMLAFNILQETLLPQETAVGPDSRLPAMNGTGTVRAKKGGLPFAGSPSIDGFARSRSRSKMYRLGAGKQEYSRNGSPTNDAHDNEEDAMGMPPSHSQSASADPDVKLWTGSELELVCQQNSAIALVLSFLQAALPYDVEEDGAVTGSLGPASTFNFSVPGVVRNQSQSSAYQI